MNTSFDPTLMQWNIPWPGRVARHDLVYLSPPDDPTQGIPLGNGDVGVLCWCDGSKLMLAVNKCDLWDDAPFERFHNWEAKQEECNTTLRHACRIVIDFKFPVFDSFYLTDFEGRLSLADATMSLRAEGPFGSVRVKAYVHHDDGSLRCQIKSKLKEPVGVDVTMERFGSRTFAHWYSLINRDAGLGLEGTTSSTAKAGMFIQHKLTGGTFAVGAKVIGKDPGEITYTREHAHAVTASVADGGRNPFEVIASVTAPLDRDSMAAARAQLAAVPSATDRIAGHRRAWKRFWLRSLMECGDEYLDNLWHLAMYYANASQRGKYPGRFIDGLWGWNRDFRAWNFYFHWNQQQLYWPLHAAGHHDLLDSYLEYRFTSLPHARRDAKELFGADGAFVSDVCDRRGCNSTAELENHTPVAQIALDFYRHFQYTGDREFLRERALPYLIEAATFFESLFKKEADGLYHAQSGGAYEGWILLRDSITEIASAKALFDAAINACGIAGLTHPRLARWREITDHLVPLPTMDLDPARLDPETGAFTMGAFKNDTPCSDKILCCGRDIETGEKRSTMMPRPKPAMDEIDDIHRLIQKREAGRPPVTVSREDWTGVPGLFPWSEFAPVFPSTVLGLADRQSEAFKAAVNTAKLFSPSGTGWDPLPVVLARLGLGRELAAILSTYPDDWQIHVNGFTHWGIPENIKSESSLRFYRFSVNDAGRTGEDRENPESKLPFAAWPFRHASLEALYVLATALNEALLQSHDGILRVAPAVHAKQNARFTLHAIGGFVVSSEIVNGTVRWIALQSKQGTPCRIQNPWRTCTLYSKKQEICKTSKRIIEFPTKRNQRFMLAPDNLPMNPEETCSQICDTNRQPKTSASGMVGLGLPRMF